MCAPACAPVSMRTPGPDGSSKAPSTPADGCTVPSADIVSAFTRNWMAMPRGPLLTLANPSSASERPAAMSSCARTRSMPVISSVTVCSTCRRALASINTNAGLVACFLLH